MRHQLFRDASLFAFANFQTTATNPPTTPSSQAGGTVALQGQQDETPVATKGFGAREYADTARQAAGNAMTVDPFDVSMKNVFTNSQALTVDSLGKSFVGTEDQRGKIANANDDWREIIKQKINKP